MKVYIVKAAYSAGHEHGYYQSPPFANRMAAEDFRGQVLAENEVGHRYLYEWLVDGPDDVYIEETEVLDACPKLAENKHYLHVTYT